MNKKDTINWYKGKRVLITGDTGFKGSWLSEILLMAGAEVFGFSLEAPTEPSLFQLAGLGDQINQRYGDVRDFYALNAAFDEIKPEVVIHLAAQPIVRTSYREPRLTYETNVMGTVNLCEAVRQHMDCVRSVLNVTTDKVYLNREWPWGYRENDPLDGYDPYSNSKSCSELVTHSYIRSFFGRNKSADFPTVSTARAGNVIGGGDFSLNRIIPDCVRAAIKREPMVIRNPKSIRPYQHVLEPLFAYLTIVSEQEKDQEKAGCYNIGPSTDDCITTDSLVRLFGEFYGSDFSAECAETNSDAPHEAGILRLDTSLIQSTFDYHPTWHIVQAVQKTVEWTKEWQSDSSVHSIQAIMEKQIQEFIAE